MTQAKFKELIDKIFDELFSMESPSTNNYYEEFYCLGLDMLDEVELIMEIEKRLNISIPDHVCENFKTLNDIANYVLVISKAQ